MCRAASLDVEPVYTFRAHVGPVLSLAVSATGEQCFSGGMDTTIRCWNIPNSNIDPYDSFGEFWGDFTAVLFVAFNIETATDTNGNYRLNVTSNL